MELYLIFLYHWQLFTVDDWEDIGEYGFNFIYSTFKNRNW